MLKSKSTYIILTFAAVLSLLFSGCLFKDYDKIKIDFFDSSFSWNFSIEDAKEYIKNNQLTESDIEVEKNSNGVVYVSDEMYNFRFNDGKLEFVSYYMGQDSGCLRTLQEWYGEYDDCEKVNQYATRYHWYGKMAGENTHMYLEDCKPNWYLRFEIKD